MFSFITVQYFQYCVCACVCVCVCVYMFVSVRAGMDLGFLLKRPNFEISEKNP